MLFAHNNPTANLFLKQGDYPRKTGEINIKSGAVINPGAIITLGVTVGRKFNNFFWKCCYSRYS